MLRKMFSTFAVVVMPLVASAQTANVPAMRDFAPDTVSVTGSGKVSATPDRVSFSASVETTAPTVQDAVNQNSARTSQMIAALKKAGATDKEIRTSNFSLMPQYEYIENRRPRVIGFQATNSVTVSRRQPGEAGKLLSVALENGANNVSGLTFGVENQETLRSSGLQLAMADARRKAELLATAAGRTVGRALTIVEGYAPAEPPRPMYGKVAAMEARVADVPVEPGAEELMFAVSVVFELK